MKTIAYLRVSTDKQDEHSQRQIIQPALTGSSSEPVTWLADTASGSTPWQTRQLATALEQCSRGDRIVVSEISRIARSTVGVLTFLQAAADKGVTVEAVKSGMKLDGSMQAKIVVTVLGLAAEIERDLLRARTKAALDARKERGLAIGRQQGATGKQNKLKGKESEVEHLLAAKVPRASIARILHVSRQTLHKFITTQKESNNA